MSMTKLSDRQSIKCSALNIKKHRGGRYNSSLNPLFTSAVTTAQTFSAVVGVLQQILACKIQRNSVKLLAGVFTKRANTHTHTHTCTRKTNNAGIPCSKKKTKQKKPSFVAPQEVRTSTGNL